jgi:ParB family chromosome partitioning protein
LRVRPNGKGYLVLAGGKRLEAAHALVKSGDWKADAAIPVVVVEATDAEARDQSLTENVVRENMHPVDEFRAFAELHADKKAPLSVAEIATRYGISERHVEQRLALGTLDETILTAWQKGDIKIETAQALTLCPTKKDQVRIFAKLQKEGRISAYGVKAALKIGNDNIGRFLNVIGEAAYLKRGGKVTRDLFGTDHVVSDEALVKTMMDETLAAVCKELVDKHGWAWATSDVPNDSWNYPSLQAQFKPTPEEKKKLDNLKAISDDDNNGYDDDNNGYDDFEAGEAASEAHDTLRAEILSRSITAKQKATAGCFVRVANDGTLAIDYGRMKPKAQPAPTTKFNPRTGQTEKIKAKSSNALTQAMRDRLKEQRLTAIKNALIAHPHGNDLALMLARIVASQITPSSRYNNAPDAVSKCFDAIADGIAPKVMNAALRKAFDPKGYFAGVSKGLALAAITEGVNADEARKVSNKKKGEIAKAALANVPKTGWLPKELRTAHYDGPKPKAKKPAPKK